MVQDVVPEVCGAMVPEIRITMTPDAVPEIRTAMASNAVPEIRTRTGRVFGAIRCLTRKKRMNIDEQKRVSFSDGREGGPFSACDIKM